MLYFGVFSRGFRVGWRGKAQRAGSGAALCVKAVQLNAAGSSMSDESAFKRKGAASLPISLARLLRHPLWCTARSATLHSQEEYPTLPGSVPYTPRRRVTRKEPRIEHRNRTRKTVECSD